MYGAEIHVQICVFMQVYAQTYTYSSYIKHEWRNVKWYTLYIHACHWSVPSSTRRFCPYMSVLHFRAQLPESPSSLVLWPPALMLRWAHGCIILSMEDGKVTCPHGEFSRWSLFCCQGFSNILHEDMNWWVWWYANFCCSQQSYHGDHGDWNTKTSSPSSPPPTGRRTWLRNQ